MSDRRQHWESVYRNKATDALSWFQPHAVSSLWLIQRCAGPHARVIDVGGGASVLIDDLLDAGYRNPAVLDLAEPALAASRDRLGERAGAVEWIAADITRTELPAARYDVWHDRAVFHFLTTPDERARYVGQVLHAVKPGGHVIVAAFGPGGPLQCSGLDVVRYVPVRCMPSSARPSACSVMKPKFTTLPQARIRNSFTATACGCEHA